MPRRRNQANQRSQVEATIPEAKILAVNPAVAVVEIPMKDFGRDKNLKTLLKSVQPKAFIGEGADVPKFLRNR